MKVVVSNGSFKFHLAPAAAELHRHGALDRFISGAYPAAWVRSLARWPGLGSSAAFRRLLDREEHLPASKVHALWAPEALIQLGRRTGRLVRSPAAAVTAEAHAMTWYAAQARRIVERANADVYHYRSGYGRSSLAAASRRGMLTLCDHSIADPRLVDHLIAHGGRFPDDPRDALGAAPASSRGADTHFWRGVLDDIRRADHVVVNSDFVRSSMLLMGFEPARIHVVYLGVDDQFLRHVENRPEASLPLEPCRPLRLAFAGGLIARKGFDTLVQALQTIDDVAWTIDVAGGAEPEVIDRHRAFFGDPRVRYRGTLPRHELASLLSRSDVFVFPSLVEGSARVVFEAMACGCFIIATDNSGSILEHGVHGYVIAPGSAEDIARKIRQAAAARGAVASIGRANRQLVLARYRQADYGGKLLALYERLLSSRGTA